MAKPRPVPPYCRAVDGSAWVRLEIGFELAGFNFGEIQDLVDEAEQVGAGGVPTARRFLRLFRAESRRVGDHHLGQSDDGVGRRAQLVTHAGDKLRLVLARHLELAALFFDFRKQIGVLNGQHRLRHEGRQQIDVCWGIRGAPFAASPEY
jgi:hypothetical protein